MKKEYQNRRIRLLIIDDEVGFADVLAKRLSKRGISVMQANSGSQAIKEDCKEFEEGDWRFSVT